MSVFSAPSNHMHDRLASYILQEESHSHEHRKMYIFLLQHLMHISQTIRPLMLRGRRTVRTIAGDGISCFVESHFTLLLSYWHTGKHPSPDSLRDHCG